MIPETTKDCPNHAKRKWVEKTLSGLPYVKWDRLFYNDFGDRDELTVFGWIDREQDSYKDFVALWFDFKKWRYDVAATSSAKYSAELVRKWGVDNREKKVFHIPCQRCEDLFDLENCIKGSGAI